MNELIEELCTDCVQKEKCECRKDLVKFGEMYGIAFKITICVRYEIEVKESVELIKKK